MFAKAKEDDENDPEEDKNEIDDKPTADDNKIDDDDSGATDDDIENNKPVISDELKQELIAQGKLDAFKELGLNDDDENMKFIEFFKSFMESQNVDEPQETNETKELRQELLLTEAKVEALKSGAKPEFVDDVIALALNKKQEHEKLEEVINDLKSKYDFFFGEDSDDEETKGTGISRRNRKGKTEVKGLGARLAAQRKPQETKTSYWN